VTHKVQHVQCKFRIVLPLEQLIVRCTVYDAGPDLF
jgi:hypothetical protein